MQHALDLFLVLVTGVLFVLLVRIRPGGKPLSKRKAAGLLIVGFIIGVIFVTTNSLYVTPTGL
ncbi:hypothetical protein [Alicyclobacillus acidoterrestris]|uniref:Uncharacterized protein n=1 Tax=Alicyclobacillus acidoterrestris (strain ATCC 49025 / DSM 3922 / CIP 106132 / NCIMB 13137 / GD3B) TaxID=1356854 RepID=T0BJM2_ALIAG|nr:hypothetical protein [Alicyclobacillus acidoterrestris]EPZ44168.1 hypothetical protein N007_11635 [Alicyclobacillus acidoterrestris ATCC 49025]UNO49683.1 hypothetical protein K1I37_03860 [Alicyclobacillus acidoterrestris]